jgi:hypothetical protein
MGLRSLILAACGVVLVTAVVVFAQAPAAQTGASRDLPSTVIAAFDKAYPNATILTASQERQDGKIAFRVECMDKGRRRVLVYDLNGSVLEAAEQVDEKDLPQPVAAAVHTHPRAVYVRGMKITRGLNVHYELLLRGTRKSTMIVRPDGSIVSFK